MNVMQVVAYLRLLVDWSANANMMLQSMHNATTLENLIDAAYDNFKADFNDSFQRTDE